MEAPGPAPTPSIESALGELELRGARAFDAASCDCVRSLLSRAGALPARASALLVERANVHLARLSARFEAASARAEQRLELAEHSYGALPRERAALARGELSSVGRSLRRLDAVPVRHASSQLMRVASERGRRAHEYEAALSELVTTIVLARATDVVPEQAGPYNPLRIASDLLVRMRSVSPIYLGAQLKRLDELAGMLALPELPESQQPPKAKVLAQKPSPAPKPARSSGASARNQRQPRVRTPARPAPAAPSRPRGRSA